MNVGFIGLGIMGSAMAHNIIKNGHTVTVWNRTEQGISALVTLGAVRAATPRDVAASCDVTCTMMATPESVEVVRDGSDGIMAGLGAGKGYIDFSTVDATTSRESARLTHQRGGFFLEAPVAGSRKPAEEGSLTIMAAGDRRLYEHSLPILQAVGKKLIFTGEVGSASHMKLANNLIMAGMLTALSEGMALATACGLDLDQLLEVLDSGALSNPMFRLKGPAIAAAGAFPAAFPLKHMQKDLRLALRLGEETGQPLFTTATVNELFKTALAKGLGDADFAAIGKVIRDNGC